MMNKWIKIIFLFGIFCIQNSFSQNDTVRVVHIGTKEKESQVDSALLDALSGKIMDPVIIGTGIEPLVTNNTISVGIGSSSMYDTYLSPLYYKGTSIRLTYEQMRRTTWFNYKFYKQQVFDLEVADGDNPAKTAKEYWVLANYRLGGHYAVNYDSHSNLRLGVGGLWDTSLGVLYNERNGNNPASARAYSNLSLSVMASCTWKKFAFRWQLDSPVAGILFSPEYGQSYYQMTLGGTLNVVNFASLHNQRALRSYLTVDFAIGSYIIRGGYLASFYQTKVHGLQTHHYSNSFVIGFPIESVKRQKDKAENMYWGY